MIKLENISKSYQTPRKRIDVLKNIDLEIRDKGIFIVFGPSGIGKTTMLNLIGGMDKPTSGRILIDGSDIAELGHDQLANLRKEKIGFIFQSFNLLPHLSAKDNILLPALLDKDLDKKRKNVDGLASELGIKARLSHLPHELSAGEQQRVTIARAMINSPSIILADEPTADLDDENAKKIIDILKGLNQKNGCTVVIATNDERLAQQFPARFDLK
ncbi:MAG: ABC transporter ATP-binding protein [Candidatus Omnitrophota bacterium]